jgi:hypothetical protein
MPQAENLPVVGVATALSSRNALLGGALKTEFHKGPDGNR